MKLKLREFLLLCASTAFFCAATTPLVAISECLPDCEIFSGSNQMIDAPPAVAVLNIEADKKMLIISVQEVYAEVASSTTSSEPIAKATAQSQGQYGLITPTRWYKEGLLSSDAYSLTISYETVSIMSNNMTAIVESAVPKGLADIGDHL